MQIFRHWIIDPGVHYHFLQLENDNLGPIVRDTSFGGLVPGII